MFVKIQTKYSVLSTQIVSSVLHDIFYQLNRNHLAVVVVGCGVVVVGFGVVVVGLGFAI